jgi:hypothetical protein
MLTLEEKMVFCKVHGYGDKYAAYWCAHPSCEARCGAPSAPPHHVRTRGAGGRDDDGNLLALCAFHHRMAHSKGIETFAGLYPNIADKIAGALAHSLSRR